ncbi:MAG: hypothetical protein DWQ44_07415 [Bacteroidetes bacterium]|nr:MAG: hypothetical protein DWQ33_12270 [Bacteroidota bacterium]REJ99842.1 MAG: hypothetical protein DWQ39_13035 [Bacteroidota bacterium]REK34215.1 MAG: hypothetical protein DWQ44_07415 [Bacteroidota bacterium]REK50545.1 MAG: hypothetical protein DWQ48_04325 [Bacteroidota bacterium]
MGFILIFETACSATTDSTSIRKPDYQIHMDQPVREIKYIMYEKNFMPIKGEISEDKKSVILKELEPGHKVRLKVMYEDGRTKEILKSPCYIDPVIL